MSSRIWRIGHSTRLGWYLAATLSGVSLPAWAVDDVTRARARDLVNSAVADYEAGQYQQAEEKLATAFESVKVPTVALWSARVEEKLGHWVAASELYGQVLALTPNELWIGSAQQDAQKEAANELAALEPRIPRLSVVVEGAAGEAVEVTIDDAVIPQASLEQPQRMDPGPKRVVGRYGSQTVEVSVDLKDGEAQEAVLRFPPPLAAEPASSATAAPVDGAVPPPSRAPERREQELIPNQKLWGWVSVGVGAAGASVGLVSGIMVARRYGSLSDDCKNRVCAVEDRGRVDRYDTLRTISTVGFLVGGLGGAAGVGLLITAPEDGATQVGWYLAPGGTVLRGRF
jgi:hypothetical protein